MTVAATPPDPEGKDDIREAMRVAQGARTRPKLAVAIVVSIALVVVTAGWLAGWFAPTPPIVPPQTCAGHVALQGAGTYTVTPAMHAWTAEYNTSVCAKVSYATAYSGLSALSSKTVDFAAVNSPLNATEASQLPESAIVLPVALEATAVIYNIPGVPTGIHLNGSVLASIFLGTITNWNDAQIQSLNPTTTFPASLPIVPVHCSGACPTTTVFTGYLAEASPTWNTTVGSGSTVTWPPFGDGGANSSSVADLVASTPGALGYAELPVAQVAGLTWAFLSNPAGAFSSPSSTNTTAAATAAIPNLPPETGVPSNASILNEAGTSTYPMATLEYVLVYQDLGIAYGGTLTKNTAQWLGAYVLWITTAAQAQPIPLGYAPLPSVLVTWNQDSLEKLQYYGQSVLAGGDFDGGL